MPILRASPVQVVLAVIAFIAIFLVSEEIRPAGQTAGLVAAYSFNEGSGASISDLSGNNLTGTVVGATWVAGKYGNSLSFNGTSSYVDLGNPTALRLTGSMTLEAWINAAVNPADDGQIIAKSNNRGWQLKTSPDTGPHTFGLAVSPTSNSTTQRYSTTVRALNTWYHIAGVYDASGRTVNVYVDGVLNNGTLIGDVPASQYNANVNVNIGRRTGGFYFNGRIDEVRIYNRALPQGEIQTDMNTPLGAVPPPAAADLIVTKTHGGTFTQGQTGASYTVRVSNLGGATTGAVNVNDTLPSALTATAISGPGWTCSVTPLGCTRGDVLTAGGSYPDITVTVNVASNAPSSVTNTATVSGGGETNTANNTATDLTTVGVAGQPDLTVSKTHGGTLTQGQTGATYTVRVSNVGAGATSGTVAVNDTLPSGLTAMAIAGNGWTCSVTPLACTRTDGLNAGGSYPDITVTVNVASNAPGSVTNTATVNGGGDTTSFNNTASDATTIGSSASTTITPVQHVGKDAGTTNSSTLAFGAANTAGNWIGVVTRASSTGQVFTVTDTRGNTYRRAVQYNETADATTLGVYYAENIAGGANTVTVSDTLGGTLRFAIFEYAGVAPSNSLDVVTTGQQGTGTTLNSGPLTTTTNGDLVFGMLSTANGTTFTAGSGYTLQERVPAAPSTKLAVIDRIQTVAGTTTPTATVAASNAWGTVAAAFRPAIMGPPPAADLTVVKTHGGTFTQGQTGATYTVRVSNIGGATTGAVNVNDTLPSGLTPTAISGAGWTCSVTPLGCTRGDVLNGGASYADITLTVSVASDAPAIVTNTATVSGGGETNTANNSTSDVTTIIIPDSTPPSAPGSLTATAPDGTHVSVSWGAASDNVGVVDYRLERCDSVCTTVGFVKIAAPTSTTFTDSGLSPQTTYSYIVRAEDGAGNLGPYSNPVTVTTGSTIPELVAAYAFDEGSGGTVSDLSGNGRTGSIANATWVTTGKYGRALSFNGTNARVTIPDAAALRLSTGMTLEAWVQPTAVTSAWRDVIYKGNDNYYLMATTDHSGSPGAGGTVGIVNLNTFGTSGLPLNTWTHLAATFDGTTFRLYVNGTQVAAGTQTGALASSTNPLEIGGDSIFGQFFRGLIDEVRVFNVARAPSQIQSDMATPLAGNSPLVTLNPSSLTFGTTATGSTSPAQNISLTNSGNAALLISNIGIAGTNAADFAQTNTCTGNLSAGASCMISVTFSPSAAGSRLAALTVIDNAPGSPHTASLSGSSAGFSIAPTVSVLTPALSQQFTVMGGSGGGLVWAVDGVVGGTSATGTITMGGLYSPPGVVGVHTVSVTDLSQTSNATIHVTNHAGVFTHHNDNARTGQNLGETVLTPTNVNAATFGKLMSFNLDGMAMASPLYVAGVSIPGQGVHNVVYVATQHNSVYAFDADGRSAAPLWQRSFLGAGVTTVPAADTGECCDIAPEIGITGTPVIDQASGTVYVVAKTKEGSAYRQRLHALDLSTGNEKFAGPVLLQASVPGTGQGSVNGNIPFDALRENQRPALLLSNGVIYIAFGAHGDVQPYHGWVLGYNATTLQQTMAVNLSPTAEGGGIWQANGGPAADAAGNIYVVTGNGTFDTSNTNRKNYGDSYVKISPNGTILDFFTPHDQGNINANNFDLGAAGPMILPNQPGPNPNLLISAGKNNNIYLLKYDLSTTPSNPTVMGGFNSNNDNQIVQSLVNIFPFGTPEPGNYSAPVYYNGTVYFGPIRDNVQAFRLTNGLLSTTAISRSSEVFNYPGASMAISASGASNGILWAVQRNGDCGVLISCPSAAPGVLKAYDAGNLANLLYSSNEVPTRDALDFASKFSVPLVANGKVIVASMSKLTIYGLLP